MDISEVARRTGLPSSTVRFYEKAGLITATSAPGERRHFRPAVLDQLALIALGQAGGLSLDEIRSMLPLEGALQVDRQLLLDKADSIDATIKRLKAMSQGLRHAADCPAPDHGQCPNFQRLLKVAAGTLKRSRTARTPPGSPLQRP
ncbi:helix-turn-helix domain-containing protein [Pseudomonas extremorientalis]|jgi:DNA-binding transcriptional MerR regulator|uniref:helix-turn-helix domain-containing protein n=1 Tax=Pseudomonas TaxID=286 RepID=UPI001C9A282B|nr:MULTISPECIES: helix-turn-helix domain-containing protein [Pseudomonas]QZP23445.1 helix-turn-helix domain-containing protein [Pseudomonas sp. DR208]UUN86765.1 helix-turn-helix domain-containing protein [Pseudomonas extremorientalis]WLG54622.1 helix-turn-helix domain-containing protein [Pseudomonas extremorientalis]